MNISVSINRAPVGPARVLAAQQLGAFSGFGHFGGLAFPGHVGQICSRPDFNIRWGAYEKFASGRFRRSYATDGYDHDDCSTVNRRRSVYDVVGVQVNDKTRIRAEV